jgi:hypothetical protein
MTDHLAIALRNYLERTDRSALDVERTAGLPNATIARIFTGRHPRADSMSALLRAVPFEVARDLIIAYIKDDCPNDWIERLVIDVLSFRDGLQEQHPTGYTADNLKPGQTVVEEALAALTKAAEGDASLRDWLIDTARLLNLIP